MDSDFSIWPTRWLFLIFLPFAGCAPLEPQFHPCSTKVKVPATWKEGAPGVMSSAIPMVESWWSIFDNAQLTALIQESLRHEPDVRKACARVREWHAKTQVARSRIWPRLDFSPGYVRDRISETDSPLGIPPAIIGDAPYSRYRLPFDISYSIDVFGGSKHLKQALEKEAIAAESDLDAAALLVSSEVAHTYFLLQALRAEQDILCRTLDDRNEAIGLQQALVDAGKENEQSLALAKLEAAKVEVELTSVRGDLRIVTHGLARLTGKTPGHFDSPGRRTLDTPPLIPSGLPADMLKRRPDLIAARKRMEAALDRVEAARLAYFPVLDLTTGGGLASADLARLISAESLAWSVGASLTQTLFDGGQRKREKSVREAQFDQLVADYDRTLLNAFREVEDALSLIESTRSKLRATEKAMGAAEELSEIALARFDRGLSTYLSVINAQRSLLEIQLQRNRLRLALNEATIQLIVALGCGC